MRTEVGAWESTFEACYIEVTIVSLSLYELSLKKKPTDAQWVNNNN